MSASSPEASGILERLADDCVWTVGGRSALAGEYRGRPAIAAFLRRTQELTDGTYAVEIRWQLAGDGHGVTYYRARGRRPDGREIDLDQALVLELGAGGLATRVRALPFDQGVFDRFWS